MKTKIFYFSATGNSLLVAKNIASSLTDVELVSIPKILFETQHQNNYTIDGVERIGFIFPVYAWGVPKLVRDFLNIVTITGDPYIFAITTSGGTPGNVLPRLQKLIHKKGFELKAGFNLSSDSYTFDESNLFVKLSIILGRKNKDEVLSFKHSEKEIVDTIINKKTNRLSRTNFLHGIYTYWIQIPANMTFKSTGKHFKNNSKCTNCDICMKVCPRKNIVRENDTHVWGGNCLQCFACMQWCPRQAIDYKELSISRSSHNKEIKLIEIIRGLDYSGK